MPIELRIQIPGGPVPVVGGLFDNPTGTEVPILFAHGAGLDMDQEFMTDVAEALAERGHPVLRFRYPYMERIARGDGKRPPDRFPDLEACHLAASVALAERVDRRRPVLIAKSMGCRVGANLAALGVPCVGLAFLGYPLHAEGKTEDLRDENFGDLELPALFLQGTHDKLADLKLIQKSIEKYSGAATLQVIEGANHSFQVMRAQKLTPLQVRTDLAERVHAWALSL